MPPGGACRRCYGEPVTSDNPARKRSTRKRPETFDRFEELTRRLIRVPKREIDDAVKQDKERRSQQ